MNREESITKISRVVGCSMFLLFVIGGYLLSSLISWTLNFGEWNLLSKIIMVLAIIYSFVSLKYNSMETKVDVANARSIDAEMKPLFDEISIKTQKASVEQKCAILFQCTKMTKFAKYDRDINMYRIAQRLEYVMSEVLRIKPQQVKDYFSKRKAGLDMEIIATIRNNLELRDFLLYFFNIYCYYSVGNFDFNGGPSSFNEISGLCNDIDRCFGLTTKEGLEIIDKYKKHKV